MNKTEIKLVTPVLAEEILQSSRGNRKIKSNHLHNLVKTMLAGNWPESIQSNTISFDSQGRLADGHHRLNAIIKSGVSLMLTLEYGLSDHDIKLLDCGMARSYADVLAMEGWTSTRSMEAIIKLVHHCAYGWEKSLTKDQMDKVKINVGEQVQKAVKYGNNSIKQTTIMLAKEWILACEPMIVDQIMTGFNVEKNSIADVVRRIIDVSFNDRRKWKQQTSYLICLDALSRMENYLKDKPFLRPRRDHYISELSDSIRFWIEK